ncbi:hypothetical protein G4Y79_03690 [Phototrophicus methaneseepsis]|uniref:Uncharacterized protein n=1 Tax=Phototrophicus methaneseepsis TaxID=2710758 RepID=A0A7S8EAQ8_9CHLR|nr:hypothetical protein [Phototrophicus methaneseepsis]QPC83496.1 hypothetical protein G4Y79_03690 [Phototrophicus methaneseepsis]
MPEDKTQRRAVVDPLLLVLKSRRVLIALSALIVGLLTLAVPELAFVRTEVLVLLMTLALALIGGYTIEDAAAVARQSNPAPLPETQIRELVDAIIDALTQEDVTP